MTRDYVVYLFIATCHSHLCHIQKQTVQTLNHFALACIAISFACRFCVHPQLSAHSFSHSFIYSSHCVRAYFCMIRLILLSATQLSGFGCAQMSWLFTSCLCMIFANKDYLLDYVVPNRIFVEDYCCCCCVWVHKLLYNIIS